MVIEANQCSLFSASFCLEAARGTGKKNIMGLYAATTV